MDAPRIIVLMGPAGAGKTTVGKPLAESLGWLFLDADDFHSPENVERMRHGIALTDAERAPWLATIRAALDRSLESGVNVVLACSALKADYRQALIPLHAEKSVCFVYLRADAAVLRERLAHREGHYAGPSLLKSQLDTLEEPADALWVDASRPPEEIIARIRETLRL
ncbi:MAG: gluconokinase [Gemmatimonadaceae bacterium]